MTLYRKLKRTKLKQKNKKSYVKKNEDWQERRKLRTRLFRNLRIRFIQI